MKLNDHFNLSLINYEIALERELLYWVIRKTLREWSGTRMSSILSLFRKCFIVVRHSYNYRINYEIKL